jgi:transposase-like protein
MPKKADLTNPIFTDESRARAHLESLRWASGPYCPRCGEKEKVTRLEGQAHRPGLMHCNVCRRSFSVTVGTLFERSHIPLRKWLLAFHLMASSKKGMSAHQMHRMLGITYKTAWFMCHRIREALVPTPSTPLGGPDKQVEADETYWGQKPGRKKARAGYGHKNVVLALVERGGDCRMFHIPDGKTKTLRKAVLEHVSKDSHLMTDEAKQYTKVGREFAGHSSVDHSHYEYARGAAHVNTAEGVFSLLKRGLIGTYHHVGVQHLQRYLSEFDFRWNRRRDANDSERAEVALLGITGKRLTYRRPDAA